MEYREVYGNGDNAFSTTVASSSAAVDLMFEGAGVYAFENDDEALGKLVRDKDVTRTIQYLWTVYKCQVILP
jgi:cobalamin biosynthesis protein CobD/CbiB